MTLEEMIEEIETHVYSYMPCYGIDDAIGNKIIAALRAGQILRGAKYDWDAYEDGCKAWDAALGEHV